MKTLKTSKKDKERFAQPGGETLIKLFPDNISICLDDVFHQSTRHRKDDLGEERRRILDYLEIDRQISRHAVRTAIVKVFVGAENSSPDPRGFNIFHKPHQRTNRCQNIYTPYSAKTFEFSHITCYDISGVGRTYQSRLQCPQSDVRAVVDNFRGSYALFRSMQSAGK